MLLVFPETNRIPMLRKMRMRKPRTVAIKGIFWPVSHRFPSQLSLRFGNFMRVCQHFFPLEDAFLSSKVIHSQSLAIAVRTSADRKTNNRSQQLGLFREKNVFEVFFYVAKYGRYRWFLGRQSERATTVARSDWCAGNREFLPCFWVQEKMKSITGFQI